MKIQVGNSFFSEHRKGKVFAGMIWITGDTHGDLSRFQTKAVRRLRSGDSLIICGDFGFIWDGSAKEKKALKWLQKRKYNILFLDGKHENYDLLRGFPESEAFGGKVQSLGGNVYHLLRGEIYELEGKRIFAFGGGESSEKEFRREQDCFWDDEMPTAVEMEHAVNNLNRCGRKVDYIITHEAPVRGAKGCTTTASIQSVRWRLFLTRPPVTWNFPAGTLVAFIRTSVSPPAITRCLTMWFARTGKNEPGLPAAALQQIRKNRTDFSASSCCNRKSVLLIYIVFN